MNLLQGLSPEIAASFLKSAFLLGSGSRPDSFWIDTATELSRNTLGLLSFTNSHYTLQGLYSYLFDPEAKEIIDAELNEVLATGTKSESEENQENQNKDQETKNEKNEKNQRLLKTYLRYHDLVFAAFDDKVKSGVNATIAQVLSPFNHPDLIDAFCQPAEKTEKIEKAEKTKTMDGVEDEESTMESVLDGRVFLVDMPLARWGLGAKVAYTFIKLKFFNLMQSRNTREDLNQDKPVFFMCDEYQELISASKDGLSDLNFWDKSRSSKTIGIISAQSISSFYASLGDKDLAHAILQNFRQKICFRTEDQATLSMMDALAGKARIQRKTRSHTDGDSRRGWTEPMSTHQSGSESVTEARESVLDATLFRNLTPNQAVAILSINGRSMDDVLDLFALFV